MGLCKSKKELFCFFSVFLFFCFAVVIAAAACVTAPTAPPPPPHAHAHAHANTYLVPEKNDNAYVNCVDGAVC